MIEKLQEFYDNHPDTSTDEYYNSWRELAVRAVYEYLMWLETGHYGHDIVIHEGKLIEPGTEIYKAMSPELQAIWAGHPWIVKIDKYQSPRNGVMVSNLPVDGKYLLGYRDYKDYLRHAQ